AISREYAMQVGHVDEGCYLYCSFAGRPGPTVFIKWGDINHIYMQDGQHLQALAIYSPGPHGGKSFHAQSDMPGFGPFVKEVSLRFFGSRSYLDSVFKHGGHSVRRFLIWPKNELLEQGAA